MRLSALFTGEPTSRPNAELSGGHVAEVAPIPPPRFERLCRRIVRRRLRRERF